LFGNYSTIDEGYGQNTTNLLNLNNFVHIRKQDLMDANSLKKKISNHFILQIFTDHAVRFKTLNKQTHINHNNRNKLNKELRQHTVEQNSTYNGKASHLLE
jgi:hypothetical protein